MGFFINGVFISFESRPDGTTYVLVSCGIDAYRIKLADVDVSLLCSLSIGDYVTVSIRPVVYNGKLYLTGYNLTKGGNPIGKC